MPRDERVVVIGAGPVGLCLALALAQAGIRVTLVEQLVEEALAMAKESELIDLQLLTEFIGFTQDADGIVATVKREDGSTDRIAGAYIVSGEGARSIVRKDLDIEFEGFTYSDRTLNIEVAYDFRKHRYTERNYISDPDEWSNLFHWKGPPDRWRVHFPATPHADQTALPPPHAFQPRLRP